MSSAWVPIEPVEPSMTTFFIGRFSGRWVQISIQETAICRKRTTRDILHSPMRLYTPSVYLLLVASLLTLGSAQVRESHPHIVAVENRGLLFTDNDAGV